MRARSIIATLMLSLLAVAGARGADKVEFYGSGPQRQAADALHGKPALELQGLTWVQGGPLKLQHLRGKVVLLDFWAQWCGPCLQALPVVEGLKHKYQDKGLVVIGIHSSRGADKLPAFLKERKIENPVAIEEPEKRNEKGYVISGYPTFTFIGRNGKIRFADVLPTSLETAAAILLAEPAPPR